MLGKIQRTLFGLIALIMVVFITLVVVVRVVGSIVASEPERVSAWVESAFDVNVDYQQVQVQSHLDALYFDVQELSFSTDTVDFTAQSLQFDVRVFESILKGRLFGDEFRANKVRFSALTSDDDNNSTVSLSDLWLPWGLVRLEQLSGDIHRDDGLWQLSVDDLITSTYKPFAGNAQVRLSHNHVPLMERFNFSFAQEPNAPEQFRFWAALTGMDFSDSLSSHWVVHGLSDVEQGLASGSLFSTVMGRETLSIKSDWYWNPDETVATNFLINQQAVSGRVLLHWPAWVESKQVSAQLENADIAQIYPWVNQMVDVPAELSGEIVQASLMWDGLKKDWTGSFVQLNDFSVVVPKKGHFVKHLDIEARANQSVWSGTVKPSKWPVQLSVPEVFSAPVVIEKVGLPFELNTDNLSVSVRDAILENPDWRLKSDATVRYLPESADVELDVSAKMSDVSTEMAQVLLPDRILSPMAVQWLREHIQQGKVKNAYVRLKGTGQSLERLNHPQHNSYFSADISGLEIVDLPNQWPNIEVESGRVEVVNGATSVYVSKGVTRELELKEVEAKVYRGERHTRLALTGEAVSEKRALIDWLKHTPLNERLNLQANHVDLNGRVAGEVQLDLALIEGDEPSTVVADLWLDEVALSVAGIELTELSGDVRVTESDVRANQLTLKFKEHPFEVNVETILGANKAVKVDAQGLFKGEDWHSALAGVSPLKVGLLIPWKKGHLTVKASSQLETTSIELPFLRKPVNELLPVNIEATQDRGDWVVTGEIGTSSRLNLRQQNDQWNIELDMPTLKGVIVYSDQWVNADFERLYVFSKEAASVCDHSEWIGVGQQWRVNIQDLKRNQQSMGRLELNIVGTESGYDVEKVRLLNHSASIDLQGRWNRQDQRVVLVGEVRSDSLKDMFDWVGLDKASVSANQVHGYVNLNAFGGLECLSLQTVSGSGEWVLNDGTIESAEPGIGRLIGLLNFESIKRRLLFDLSDVMGKGLSYDKIWAKVSLSEGLLSVEQLKVEAPSTQVKMWGQVDLLDSIYDLNAKVSPNLRNAAVTVGALTGGPAGAVVGWLGERVMNLTGLSKAVEYQYTITGPFDSPKVEPAEK